MRLFKKRNKAKQFFLLAVLIVTGIIIYYWFFEHGHEVNNNMAKPVLAYQGHQTNIWQARFIKGDSLIASASVDGSLQLWTREGKMQHVLQHPQGITRFSTSSDGKYIATSSYDGVVRIWDLHTYSIIKELKDHEGTVWEVAYSPDDSLLATAGEDKIIRIWNATTGALVKRLQGHTMNIWALAFTKDGRQLISGGFDKSIRVWDLQSGTTVQVIKQHTEAVVSLAVSADGSMLASGSDDGTICLWQLPQYKLVRTLRGSLHHVYGLAFHPAGNLLLSGHLDKPAIGEVLQNFFGDSKYNKGISIRIWDVNGGRLLQTLSEHGNDVNDVAWSNDGKYFVSASEDETVRLWEMKE